MKEDYSTKIDTGFKQYGAISPEGKFYPCGYAGHNDLEYSLIKKGILEESPNFRRCFEWNGWVKLTGSYMTVCEFQFEGNVLDYDFKKREDILVKEIRITKEQVEAIKSYIKALGRDKLNFNFSWFNVDGFEKILDYDGDLHEFKYKEEIDEPKNEREEVDKGY
ncbi:MAG: hypothetical protein WBA57_04160 [Elainellaceae cyanobacterium]